MSSITIIPILEIRRLRLRKFVAHGHTANEWQSWGLNAGFQHGSVSNRCPRWDFPVECALSPHAL